MRSVVERESTTYSSPGKLKDETRTTYTRATHSGSKLDSPKKSTYIYEGPTSKTVIEREEDTYTSVLDKPRDSYTRYSRTERTGTFGGETEVERKTYTYNVGGDEVTRTTTVYNDSPSRVERESYKTTTYERSSPYGKTTSYERSSPYGRTKTYERTSPYGKTTTYERTSPLGRTTTYETDTKTETRITSYRPSSPIKTYERIEDTTITEEYPVTSSYVRRSSYRESSPRRSVTYTTVRNEIPETTTYTRTVRDVPERTSYTRTVRETSPGHYVTTTRTERDGETTYSRRESSPRRTTYTWTSYDDRPARTSYTRTVDDVVVDRYVIPPERYERTYTSTRYGDDSYSSTTINRGGSRREICTKTTRTSYEPADVVIRTYTSPCRV